jgi:hypothetical protein
MQNALVVSNFQQTTNQEANLNEKLSVLTTTNEHTTPVALQWETITTI